MYELVYSIIDGTVSGINSPIGFIPNDDTSTDFQAFLRWNAEQAEPLNLDSTIPVIVPEPATQIVYELPVVAPDFIVQSPKPKKDPKEAHARAIEISKMDKKSIAEIVLNMMVWQEDAEKRLKKAGI